ncbi:MAG TPA: DUF819 family protein [Gammaproteobacteria bacterium]|nr:DUF819 family protein [Xanthomonadales bacterium]MCB1595933.1 DUF819 family protein [Xanthomonadales bacterium]HOP21963.1 DUF819 family protein [Gammaproteobacteria bacterium]HPI95744.1 DUF819 family protein [Gammaproteobacteria bacterium]HPQ87789.1 DUF819 family protein [Gammaproteobacteria bacterium]
MNEHNIPLIQSDAVLFGILAAILGLVFWTHQHQAKFWKKFYGVVPALLLCYFLPSLLNSFGLVDAENSKLYYVASRYLLPAALVLLTISVDLKGIIRLGPKAGIMFLTGTLGIIIGGPIAFIAVKAISPETFAGSAANDIWRGMTTLAGSWIGGGANQAAMKEIFAVSDAAFTKMIAVDVIWANIWMATLLFMSQRANKIDTKTGADTSAIERIKLKMETFQTENARKFNLNDLMFITAVAFVAVGIGHAFANWFAPYISNNYPALNKLSLGSAFFWLVVISTFIGVMLSFTKARKLEGGGASAVGSVFIYILVATIGLKMDVTQIFDDPVIFLIGGIWISIHAILLLVVGKLIKAPLFFLAVGSQANVGGAASAPVVASAFHPSLAPVGVLLAVFGYTIGTLGAWFTGILLQMVAG